MTADHKPSKNRTGLMLLFIVAIAVMAWLAMPARRGASGQVVVSPAAGAQSVSPAASRERQIVPIGFEESKPLSPTANPAVAQVAAALKTGLHPEHVTPLAPVPVFDPAAFARDPAAYCAQSVPGRALQTAPPSALVPALAPRGVTAPGIRVGGSCPLSAHGVPSAPVTFTTFDLGGFPNGLTSITVQADATGQATTTYQATPGTIGAVNILAGSPLASGQVEYRVTVYGNDVVQVPR